MASIDGTGHGWQGAGSRPRPAVAEVATQTEQKEMEAKMIISRKVEYVVVAAPKWSEVIFEAVSKAIATIPWAPSMTTTQSTATGTTRASTWSSDLAPSAQSSMVTKAHTPRASTMTSRTASMSTKKYTFGGNGGNGKAGVYSTQHTKYDGSTVIYCGGSGYGYQGTEYDNDTKVPLQGQRGLLYVRWM